MAIVPGSLAKQAGLEPNDVLLAIGGVPVPANADGKSKTSYPVENALEQLNAALAKRPVKLDIQREGEGLAILLTPATGCASRMISIATALADYTLFHERGRGLTAIHPLSHCGTMATKCALRHFGTVSKRSAVRFLRRRSAFGVELFTNRCDIAR